MTDDSQVDAATTAKMRGNTRADTKPELRVRSALHRAGLRFRKDYRVDLGLGRGNPRPDIAFTRKRVAIFIDGCFWHDCPQHGRRPVKNASFWEAKLQGNVQRDRRNTSALQDAGWTVLRFWEHEDVASIASRISHELVALSRRQQSE